MKTGRIFQWAGWLQRTVVALALGSMGSGIPAFAAPLERDLGMRLSYVRVHALPQDLPAPPAGRLPSTVLDLRYVKADGDAAAAVLAWIRTRATARSPVFVLANASTSSDVLRALAVRSREPGIVLIGIAEKGFAPDVAVRATADEEKRAYDALESGTDVAALLADNPNKVRHDEASLSRDRPIEPTPEPAEKSNGKSPVNAVDAVLQRAVHLHRSLVALKRL